MLEGAVARHPTDATVQWYAREALRSMGVAEFAAEDAAARRQLNGHCSCWLYR